MTSVATIHFHIQDTPMTGSIGKSEREIRKKKLEEEEECKITIESY